MAPRPAAATTVLIALPLAVALRRWHTGWGTTRAERNAPMPGDEIPVSAFGMAATRAITIKATPEAVWPWIVQLGVGKAGWCSYDLLDNLGRHSATTVLPQWQEVEVGDPAAPMNPFIPLENSPWRVAQVQTPKALVWRNTTDDTWSWSLQPVTARTLTGEEGCASTRLISRIRISYASPSGLAFAPLLELADFPMYRRMLLGIKQRAEAPSGGPVGRWTRGTANSRAGQ